MSRVKHRFHTFKVTVFAVFVVSVVLYSLAHVDKMPKWPTPAGSTVSSTASPHHR